LKLWRALLSSHREWPVRLAQLLNARPDERPSDWPSRPEPFKRASGLRPTRWLVLSLFLTVFRPSAATADVVWLLNGDTLTGTAQTMNRGVLTFKTPYAENVNVDWKNVAGLQIARLMRVAIRGGGSHTAWITPSTEGRLHLETRAGSSLEPLVTDVVAIAPTLLGMVITGRAETGLLATSGANDVNSLHLAGELVLRTPQSRSSTDVQLNRTQDRGLETTRNITWTYRQQEFLTDHMFANANLIVTSDRFRDIDLRVAPGIGIGYEVLDYDVTALSFDGGFGYVGENHTLEGDRNYWAARENLNYEYWLIRKRLQFFHQHDGYFGLTGDENLFIKTRTGLRINLTGGLIMTGQLGLDYDRRPFVGQSNTDRTFAITLGYQKLY
jgi:putative salt-induced outer membrane protein YdiY